MLTLCKRERIISILLAAGVWGANKTLGEIADFMLDRGVTVSNQDAVQKQWISVKERLPEYADSVLVTDIRDGYTSIASRTKGTRGVQDWWECDDTFRLPISEITHWMPLPEPPKEA